ncbi:MAG: choice-of-anchor B family protein [Nitriliruptor sp.]|uniref:choice-of-anchor B family protein n=1 Tax=Nitriliruptor sp. TaxID=2448056 RepID=UPI00349FE761
MTRRTFRTLTVALAAIALAVSTGFVAFSGPADAKLAYLSEVAATAPAWTSGLDLAAAQCTDGMAGPFPCENVDLAAVVPVAQLGGPTGNDVWGWTDPETGRDYAIAGTSAGTAFVDVTEPTAPEVVATMPSQSVVGLPLWRDIKVYADHAFVVSEHSGHGMQVFDLTRLRDGSGLGVGNIVTPDAVYKGPAEATVSNSHNVWINEDTGFAYLIGTNTCNGGLHMVDVNDPLAPTFAGCFAEDGYTHDVECVVYDGPDTRYQGHEICFASNEDTVTIVDVTDKSAPVMLSRTGYDSAAYTHQGALTPGQDWFLFGDELDEQSGTVTNTATYILDVSDLQAPGDPVTYLHDSQTIDHNMYVDDRFVHQSNYNEGLRILAWDDDLLRAGQLDEVAYFDVVPAVDVSEFAGAWSSYDFGSGTVVVNTLELGLFVLQPDLPAPDGGTDPDDGAGGPPECEDRPSKGNGKGPKHCRD